MRKYIYMRRTRKYVYVYVFVVCVLNVRLIFKRDIRMRIPQTRGTLCIIYATYMYDLVLMYVH